MKTNDNWKVLRQVPLLARLSDRELKAIAAAGREEPFSRGAEVVRQGDIGGRFFLIIEGRATAYIDGRPVQRLGPNSYFGELALIDGGHRSATVRSDTQLKTLAFSSSEFRAAMRENWTLAVSVMAGLCQRIRRLDDDVVAAAS